MTPQHLPGLEIPAQPEIEEAAEALRQAKDAAKRATTAVHLAESVLIQRMLSLHLQKHRYAHNGNYVDVDLSLPSPSVRIKVTSGDEEH